MKQFRLVDNIVGWLTFLIAAFVYCSTIEPTASFWDCPEFIDTGYKLQIGHPPGAPFFMLTANLFSQFASDPTQVARMVNMMSALLSATCILFLFWTITHLVRRLLIDRWEELSLAKMVAIEASGLVGALIYTFSDTFWFSAVEGEVYAYSSAFTAVVFWLILKWEDQADQPHSDRWLVLIMYMTGLSIGVHLLNLLCLPAIVLVWYYKRFPQANLKGSLVALFVSFVILAAVLYGVVPGIITVGGWFELLFVNVFGMSFNTGLYVYIVLLVAAVLWAIYETQNATDLNLKRQNIAFLLAFALLGVPFYGYGFWAVVIGILVLAVVGWILFRKNKQQPLVSPRLKNTALLCMLMLMIGYSTYAVIVIRSAANTPMDQNSPEDIFTLGNYLSRDQYGYRPLIWGQAYSSEYLVNNEGRIVMDEGAPIYQRREKASPDEPDRYFIVSTKDKARYAQNMLFPRMYSPDPRHVRDYESWLGGITGNQRPSNYRQGETVTIPTQGENLRFFLSYQCNFMYWRYFMWNFAGRQNGLQGNGELEKGNWITGIPFIDNARLGDQSLLPDELKQNKGHNVFYCLPLILGLIGIFWQSLMRSQKGIKQFWVVFFLFFMTGLAIVLYLNQTPEQPRERDYAYAGSFYAYAIWCGMGVAAIISLLTKNFKRGALAVAALASAICLLVPVQMASQTWDDHDRSGRFTCRDFGQNYLMSMQQEGNPIIFTNGDNDTFPLWYNMDVEGVRTDTRVCNLSYLQTDWYIDQMRRPAYDSPGLPITWSRLEYCSGTNETVQVEPRLKGEVIKYYQERPDEARQQFGDEPFELKNILKYWVRSKNKELQVIPTDTVYMTIDKEAVRRSGMMMQSDSIPDRMVISLKGLNYLDKSKLMMLELIAESNWERPIYVAYTVGQENYMNLGDNFVQEGLANRITPFTTNIDGRPVSGMTDFDTEKTYDNVMNRFKFGGINAKGIYLDETVMRMCFTHRRLLVKLATQLVLEGKNDKAAAVLERCEKEIPTYNVPHDFQCNSVEMARVYHVLGKKEKAMEVVDDLWKKSSQYLNYYTSLDTRSFKNSEQSCRVHLYVLNALVELLESIDPELQQKYLAEEHALIQRYMSKGGTLGY
ncbi:MAG: DUF2723 domain-containing protein [Prevotella sp.]|nr:DUF2723 domain-containing protein [Prevotella sp.]